MEALADATRFLGSFNFPTLMETGQPACKTLSTGL